MAFDAAVEPSNEALPKILSEHKQRVVNCGGNNPQPEDAIKQPSIFNLRMAWIKGQHSVGSVQKSNRTE